MRKRWPVGVICVLGVVMMVVCQPVMAAERDARVGISERPKMFAVPKVPVQARQAAEKGQDTLKLLVKDDDKHAQELGFASAAEAADTKLGNPYPIVFVELEKLKQWQPGDDPKNLSDLLEPTDQVIYPLIVGNKVKSSLTVTQIGAGWRTTEWGAKERIRLLNAALDNARVAESNFLVTIPALNLDFLGDMTDGPFRVIPIRDDPRYRLMRTESVSAKDLFIKLLPEAKAHDGNPR